jgi:hypothetical protein
MTNIHDDRPFSLLKISQIAALAFCLTLGTRAIYYSLSEGFCIERIATPLCHNESLLLPSPTLEKLEQLSQVTSQPFFYMKKGSQAYAFISQDKKFVLKLFKYHHMQPAEWLLAIPLPPPLSTYRDSLVQRRRYKIDLTLNSYRIAASQLQNECALLYAQMLPTNTYKLPLTIYDSIGRTHSLDLSHYGFAIQHAAQLVQPSLERWIENNELQDARKALFSLVQLFIQRSSLGVGDVDPDLHKNAGFVGTQAIFIDIGSFTNDDRIMKRDVMKRDIEKTFSSLLRWLQKRSPELATYLQSLISETTKEWTQTPLQRPSCEKVPLDE